MGVEISSLSSASICHGKSRGILLAFPLLIDDPLHVLLSTIQHLGFMWNFQDRRQPCQVLVMNMSYKSHHSELPILQRFVQLQPRIYEMDHNKNDMHTGTVRTSVLTTLARLWKQQMWVMKSVLTKECHSRTDR